MYEQVLQYRKTLTR
jgi:hypothetical protein